MNIIKFKESKQCKNIIWCNHDLYTLLSLEEYILRYNSIKDIKFSNILIRLLENDYSKINIEERINKIIELKRDSVTNKSYG